MSLPLVSFSKNSKETSRDMNTPVGSDERGNSQLSDEYLGHIDVRVDLVRMDVYRLLINAKDSDDVYLDEIFNRFISVAQAPLSFAIYNSNGELLFHLINDIKYHDIFNEKLQKKKYKDRAFDLFPGLLKGKYKILVFQVKTKREDQSNWIEAIDFRERDWDNQKKDYPATASIENLDTYLERCVWRFFHAPWDGFGTQLGGYAYEAIDAAIISVAKNFRPFSEKNIHLLDEKVDDEFTPSWPPDISTLNANIESTEIPNTNGDKGWHEKLRKIFYPAFRDSVSGLNAQHLLMHEKNDSADAGYGVPNMLVAYRSFTRESEDYRFEVPLSGIADGTKRNKEKEKKQGYLYNTQFLIPDMLEADGNHIWKLLEDLQVFSEFFEGKKTNTYERKRKDQTGNRRLYRNIFSKTIKLDQFPRSFRKLGGKDEKEGNKKREEVHGVYRYITKELDKKFWEIIASPQGVKKCVDILRSPVGKNARSLTDSAYHTGLIHTNFVFDFAGIDRIRGLGSEPTKREADKYIEENEDDLLRIVMLFYILSEMVNWNGSIKNFDPRKIAAVLIPVKMRGAVWGVTIHATYVEEELNNYKNVAYWISFYHLTTTLKVKNQKLFDRILWDNIQRRVSRTLEKSMTAFSGADQFVDAISDFNAKMLGEQRLVPYALPRIELGSDASLSKDYIELVGIDGNTYRLPWKNAENSFFLAAQEWNRVGTRSFQQSVEAGLNRGFENQ